MQRLSKQLFGNNLQKTISIVISALILVSIVLVSIFGHLRFSFDYIKQSAKNMQQIVDQLAINIDTYLDEVARLCLTPYYNTIVMEQLDCTPVNSQGLLEKRRTIENYLRQVMITPRKDIMRVYICSDSVYSSGRNDRSAISESFKEEQWYINTLASDQYVFFPSLSEVQEGSSSAVFSVAKCIHSLQNSKSVIGVIRVDANYNGIKAVCDQIDLGPNGALIITDSYGNPIYVNSSLPSSISIPELISISNDNGLPASNINGATYIINKQTIPTVNWTIIAINSTAELTKNAQETLRFNLLLAIGLAVLGMILSSLCIKRFLAPLYQTVRLMKQVQKGDLSIRAETQCTSEISYLNSAFNQMIDQIQAMLSQEKILTRQVYEAKYLQKEAQFDSLYRQIQPHFLFNTLNTISILIKCGRDKDAVAGINELSVLLRGMVHTNREISLEAELKITESYLHLQQLRHDSLTFAVLRNEVDLSYKIPALTIQPLVENALVHGCEGVDRATHISIILKNDGEFLSVAVCDNGEGMTPEALDEVVKMLSHCESQADDSWDMSEPLGGVGLVNIQRRLRLKFGNESSIVINSVEGQGTMVSMKLPRVCSHKARCDKMKEWN